MYTALSGSANQTGDWRAAYESAPDRSGLLRISVFNRL
jgi:hypothetical protein